MTCGDLPAILDAAHEASPAARLEVQGPPTPSLGLAVPRLAALAIRTGERDSCGGDLRSPVTQDPERLLVCGRPFVDPWGGLSQTLCLLLSILEGFTC